MQLTLLPGLDPFATVGAALSASKQPFLLVGEPGSDQLLAQFHADAIMQAAEFARSEAKPSGERIVELVPRIPFHIQTWEGAASCDANSVTLTWPGARIPSPKRLHQRREFALDSIARAEWVPRDDGVDAFLRIVLKDRPSEGISPRNDLHCLLGHDGEDEARLLLMAATITAHCRGMQEAAPAPTSPASAGTGSVDSEQIYERIRQLGKLHAEGILTDEEFAAKKKELLDRL
ncbi:hypothetical protein GCM10011410_16330 [Hoyosella rhizosphaerae]|uniref:SHOCT domain-containing protein n=2 Tax=Hoyosella rhizosphaerae TaxID=1755582 RepID=A0A916U8U5_9ACTN|nr:hypothetical protein GCM10011410_16330 [Hoyosella rhizosphaerae]